MPTWPSCTDHKQSIQRILFFYMKTTSEMASTLKFPGVTGGIQGDTPFEHQIARGCMVPAFWSLAPGLVLNSSNWASWGSFSGLLVPRLENTKIVGLVFATSGAKAPKWSTRTSWVSFCTLPATEPEFLPIEHPAVHFVDFKKMLAYFVDF